MFSPKNRRSNTEERNISFGNDHKYIITFGEMQVNDEEMRMVLQVTPLRTLLLVLNLGYFRSPTLLRSSPFPLSGRSNLNRCLFLQKLNTVAQTRVFSFIFSSHAA